MRIKRYKIVPLDPSLRVYLQSARHPEEWIISANDIQSAWRKFCRQRFGVLLPNPEDYDISLDSY